MTKKRNMRQSTGIRYDNMYRLIEVIEDGIKFLEEQAFLYMPNTKLDEYVKIMKQDASNLLKRINGYELDDRSFTPAYFIKQLKREYGSKKSPKVRVYLGMCMAGKSYFKIPRHILAELVEKKVEQDPRVQLEQYVLGMKKAIEELRKVKSEHQYNADLNSLIEGREKEANVFSDYLIKGFESGKFNINTVDEFMRKEREEVKRNIEYITNSKEYACLVKQEQRLRRFIVIYKRGIEYFKLTKKVQKTLVPIQKQVS